MLETFYRLEGYLAAQRTGPSSTQTTGVLTLAVDEGRLESVEVRGPPRGRGADGAIRALDLETGQRPSREADLWEALARLQRGLGGSHPARRRRTLHRRDDGARGLARGVPPATTTAPRHFRGAGPRNVGPHQPRRRHRSRGASSSCRLHRHPQSYNHWRLFGVAAYGFSSKTLRYGVGVLRGLGPAHRWSFGYNYHDWTDTDDAFRRYGLEEAPGGLINTEQGVEFYRRYGHEAFVLPEARDRGRRRACSSAATTTAACPWPPGTSPSPPTSATTTRPSTRGRMRSFIVTVRWVSAGDLFENQESGGAGASSSRASTAPTGSGSPRPCASTPPTRSRPAASAATSTSRASSAGCAVTGSSATDTRSTAAFSGGSRRAIRPLPKLFALGGLNTLRGYERKRIQGERMALVNLEWAFYPGPRWPALIGFWDGGGAWGGEPTADGLRYARGLERRPRRGRALAAAHEQDLRPPGRGLAALAPARPGRAARG